MHHHGADLFAVFAATDKLELVAEFWRRSEAEKFLDNAQKEDWRVMQGHHVFANLKWLGRFAPDAARVAFPWIENAFPYWIATKLRAAARRNAGTRSERPRITLAQERLSPVSGINTHGGGREKG